MVSEPIVESAGTVSCDFPATDGGNFGATIQTLFGGNITLYTQLCERAREEAFQLMLEHAAAMGANAIIGMRYDANDVAPGVTEVLAYGTAVVIKPPPPPR